MSWARLFKVATRDLDSDAPVIRGILDEVAGAARCSGECYRLDAEAQLAMGWWFFSIHVREEFVREAVERMHAENPRAQDERALLEHIKTALAKRGSSAVVSIHQDGRSIFTKYWVWLMR